MRVLGMTGTAGATRAIHQRLPAGAAHQPRPPAAPVCAHAPAAPRPAPLPAPPCCARTARTARRPRQTRRPPAPPCGQQAGGGRMRQQDEQQDSPAPRQAASAWPRCRCCTRAAGPAAHLSARCRLAACCSLSSASSSAVRPCLRRVSLEILRLEATWGREGAGGWGEVRGARPASLEILRLEATWGREGAGSRGMEHGWARAARRSCYCRGAAPQPPRGSAAGGAPLRGPPRAAPAPAPRGPASPSRAPPAAQTPPVDGAGE